MKLKLSNQVWSALAGAIAFSSSASMGQTPPVNDNFANRTIVTGASVTMSGNLTGSTLETSEPIGSGGSIWWQWTAPVSSIVTIQLIRDYSSWNSTGTCAYVYSGADLTDLSQIDANWFDGPAGRYVRFSATQGESYQIRAAGVWPGTFSLKLVATNPPVFVSQPQGCVISAHATAFFSALATGPMPIRSFLGPPGTTYQWYFEGSPISGQRFPSLLVHDVSTNNAGIYFVTASNVDGMSQSASATLTVTNSNPVPHLVAVAPTDPNTLPCVLSGEIGRWYEYETSTNLIWWTNAAWFGASNSQSLIFIPRNGPKQFVRASLNVPTDDCVGQLKQIRWSKYVSAIEDRTPGWQFEPLERIKLYVPLQEGGNIIPCPEWGYYNPGAIINDNPTCSQHSHGHVLTDGFVY